jgi:hypothetical protein
MARQIDWKNYLLKFNEVIIFTALIKALLSRVIGDNTAIVVLSPTIQLIH